MSLNNNQMLPERVRNMRQMNDVLNAEDIILAEIERIIDEMYQRASLLHEEIINEEWLEGRIQEITGGSVDVAAAKDALSVEITVNKGDLSGTDDGAVRVFLDKWLPSHLAYSITYEKLLTAMACHAAVWQDDEIMVLRQVRI